MKLLSKYNRANITATIIVLLLSSICYYFILHYVLIDQLDDDLKVEELEIIDYVKANNNLPNPTNYKDQQVLFQVSNDRTAKRKFSSSDIFNTEEKEYESTRQLQFPLMAGGKAYIVSIRKSQEETEDLVQLILLITAGMVVLLLLILFLINRFLFNKLWRPFNATLTQLKQFNISNKNSMRLGHSNISEFTELNIAVATMAWRVSNDYDALKNFTENASHEIQTPLAIIKSKLELLTQADNLKEEQILTIQSIQRATNRLSKLNQSLLLLTKIENQQFLDTEEIDLGILFNLSFESYDELVSAKHISVVKDIDGPSIVLMNETLADILVSNLVINAIKHNIEGGTIKIHATATQLSIANSGTALKTNPMELFERFKKDKSFSDSLGLGLSIVKKICERYNYTATYDYSNNLHTITINFSNPIGS